MYKANGQLTFSPSDLTTYTQSPYASWMERYAIECPHNCPEADGADSMMDLLQDKGGQHELGLLKEFQAQGKAIADIAKASDKHQATVDAMAAGVEVIFQAALEANGFKGYADFLIKVPGESDLGDYHYEVWDTKLSKQVKPSFTIQLCCYADMLTPLQGRLADEFVVALGNGEQARLRTGDYFYYYQSLKRSFLNNQHQFNAVARPNPADSSSWGRWSTVAKQQLQDCDHLSQVATMSRSQIKKFEQAEIDTVQLLIDTQLDRIPGMNSATFNRLKAQATIQRASEGRDTPLFEVVKPDEGIKQGLALLPPHSDLDVFFDIEGFPLDDGGLEYLWGNSYFDVSATGERGERKFKDFWAHNRDQEKQCFKDFIEWVYARWQQDPSMHIYHYANYEIAACRKLMSRYGVCEHEVDQLLRNDVFVDLYKLVKNGLLIGEPRYSIKNVEHLYRGARETEVGNGGDSVVVYENWRELNAQGLEGDTWQTSKILNDIRDYNIDDCDSTQELVDWLREQQAENGIAYIGSSDVSEPELTEAKAEEINARTQLRDQLLTRAENEKATNPEQAQLTENLAWMLEFHRREAKPVFWRLFDRLGLTDDELVDDLDCLAYCQRTEREPFKVGRARQFSYEYRFDANQEFKQAGGDQFYLLGHEDEAGKSLKAKWIRDESDMPDGLIVLQAKAELPDIISLIPDEYISADIIAKSLEQVVKAYASNSLGQAAIIDFLKRSAPRILGQQSGDAVVSSHDPMKRLGQIKTAIANLDSSYLAIQGPPGAGKTFTGKHVIAELLQQGKKIGICSNSHKAINNLLLGTAIHCNEKNIDAYFACSKETDPALLEQGVSILKNTEIANHLDGACVIGTTAWGFSRDDLADEFDYLFIDEAGQVSVANLIAISRAAKNLILMGDQMQLGQPAQGTHPADSGLSVLDYLLHETPTIPDHMGVFLGTTYRMHSQVNHFISEAIYEGKLESAPDNDKQVIEVPASYLAANPEGPLNLEAGIIYLPVEHEGNSQASDEEVAVIAQQARQLLGRIFTDKDDIKRSISWSDILFVAPYNHQVNKLREALVLLPGGDDAQIGSVDKFQGQEAPIVFLSMCASDANASPRGMDFLFDKHRINVAVSRAQSLAVVVASPKLAQSQAGNIEQQKLVNVFARLVGDKLV